MVSLLAILALALQASAKDRSPFDYGGDEYRGFGPFGPNGGPFGDGGHHDGGVYSAVGLPPGYGGPITSGLTSGGFGFMRELGVFDLETASTIRLAHGVLAALAFVFLFPVGAIVIRVLPSRAAVFIHAAAQLLAYLLFIVAFALGIWMIVVVRHEGYSWLTDSHVRYHPLIGIIIFALLLPQPITGIFHHIMYKKYGRRRVWSYGHIWLGRIVVTLGIINGGLGLKLANNSRAGQIVYAVFAGLLWLVWVLAAVYGEIRRLSSRRETRGQSGHRDMPPEENALQTIQSRRPQNGKALPVYAKFDSG